MQVGPVAIGRFLIDGAKFNSHARAEELVNILNRFESCGAVRLCGWHWDYLDLVVVPEDFPVSVGCCKSIVASEERLEVGSGGGSDVDHRYLSSLFAFEVSAKSAGADSDVVEKLGPV